MKIFISNSQHPKTDYFRLYKAFPTFRSMWRGRKEDKRQSEATQTTKQYYKQTINQS